MKIIGITAILLTVAVSGQVFGAKVEMARNMITVSTEAGIRNHADIGIAGSLAWCISKADKSSVVKICITGPHKYVIGSNLFVPRNVTLRIDRGVTLDIKQGVTLSINSGFEAGTHRIFTGLGKVTGTPQIDYVRPQWWGMDRAALQAALAFKNVNLGTGIFTVDGDLTIGSDSHITGDPGCEIISMLSGNPSNYYGIFKTSEKQVVKNVSVNGVKFINTTAVGLYALAVSQGGGENISFTNCESFGLGLVFANNVKKITLSDNYCHTSTLDKLDIFDDHHHGIYLCGIVEDCIIKNNTVLGRRCHGIAVVSEAVFPPTSADPTREMIGKRILIQGNTVVSGTIKQTAGGIWVSCVQDCRILGNHIEGYQDVGIDFEGSRNCIADSNILINNNKGLALFGNCKNITFSHNTVYMTRDNEPNNGFFNTYSNGYKNIVDTRNTDIYVIGNTFNNEAKTYNEQHGSGGILVGSAKRIYFKENVFINCFFKTHYCDDLESIEIANNSFVNNFRGAAYPVVDLAISQRNKTEKQPTINYIVTGNRFSSTDDSKVSSIVNVSTVGGLPDTTPWCDLRFIIRDNIIDRETRGNTIQFTDNYQTTHHLGMQVDGVIKNNITNGLISLDIPKDGQRKKCSVLVEGNVEMVGK